MAPSIQDSDMTKAINNCFNCHRSCLETLSHILSQKGGRVNNEHISILQMCADVCDLSAKMMIQDSPFHHQSCELCYELCEACAEECEKYADDPVFQRSARNCRQCAESCRGMAGMTVKIKPQTETRSTSFN